jgi:hypothetical protein
VLGVSVRDLLLVHTLGKRKKSVTLRSLSCARECDAGIHTVRVEHFARLRCGAGIRWALEYPSRLLDEAFSSFFFLIWTALFVLAASLFSCFPAE